MGKEKLAGTGDLPVSIEVTDDVLGGLETMKPGLEKIWIFSTMKRNLRVMNSS
jgi:hypothetical protein